ncbi:MAG: heme-binding protein [Burkholderiaceae bacterium]|nr:heme-binding protein [Burkholderiaceae bacterium]
MTIPSFSPSRVLLSAALAAVCVVTGQAAWAAPTNPANDCVGLPSSAVLEAALKAVVPSAAGGSSSTSNGGLDFPMWATVVNRYGVVCAVATSGSAADDAWLNSRVISAQKAYTANGFSRPTFALSTANLFTPTQNGNSLNGLQFSNPVDPRVVYRGNPTKYGTTDDPMIGLKPGGINVFGGGVALYSTGGKLGALGVSGDTSCADHNIAWKLRNRLATAGFSGVTVANRVPGGVRSAQVGSSNQPVAPAGDDGIMYGNSGFQHADCGNSEKNIALPAVNN